MSNRPPSKPEKALARVLRLANLEGKSVVVIAGGCGMISAASGDWLGAVIGALAAAAGVGELRGVKLLKEGEPRGMDWLVRAELFLLSVILLYVAIIFGLLAIKGIDGFISPETRSMIVSLNGRWGAEEQKFALHTIQLTYLSVAVLSILFQGGMAYYYHRQRATIGVALSLADTPANNPMLTSCPACHHTVSKAAVMCPHCGHPLKPQPPALP